MGIYMVSAVQTGTNNKQWQYHEIPKTILNGIIILYNLTITINNGLVTSVYSWLFPSLIIKNFRQKVMYPDLVGMRLSYDHIPPEP